MPFIALLFFFTVGFAEFACAASDHDGLAEAAVGASMLQVSSTNDLTTGLDITTVLGSSNDILPSAAFNWKEAETFMQALKLKVPEKARRGKVKGHKDPLRIPLENPIENVPKDNDEDDDEDNDEDNVEGNDEEGVATFATGRVLSGVAMPDMRVKICPSGATAPIRYIESANEEVDHAGPADPVDLILGVSDEHVRQGSVLTDAHSSPCKGRAVTFNAVMKVLHISRPLEAEADLTVSLIRSPLGMDLAEVSVQLSKFKFRQHKAGKVEENPPYLKSGDFALVQIKTHEDDPIYVESFAENPELGSFEIHAPHGTKIMATGIITEVEYTLA